MAELVGLGKIPLEKRQPLFIHTQGLGQWIRRMVEDGANHLIIGIGGSASHDGGMAAGLTYFAGAHIQKGIDYVLDQLDFNQRVSQADLVIVGEGQLDRQSLSGKTPIGVARRTPREIPVIAICGSLQADLPSFPFENISAAFPIIPRLASLEATFQQAEENLVRTAEQVARLLWLGGQEKWK